MIKSQDHRLVLEKKKKQKKIKLKMLKKMTKVYGKYLKKKIVLIQLQLKLEKIQLTQL